MDHQHAQIYGLPMKTNDIPAIEVSKSLELFPYSRKTVIQKCMNQNGGRTVTHRCLVNPFVCKEVTGQGMISPNAVTMA